MKISPWKTKKKRQREKKGVRGGEGDRAISNQSKIKVIFLMHFVLCHRVSGYPNYHKCGGCFEQGIRVGFTAGTC